MKASHSIRAIALVVSVLVTFGAVDLIAGYAYPAPTVVRLASAR